MRPTGSTSNDRKPQRKKGRAGTDATKKDRVDYQTREAVKGTLTLTESKKQAHDEISRMMVRIRELENEIGRIQKTKSSEPHPILMNRMDDVPGLDQDNGSSPEESVYLQSPPPEDQHEDVLAKIELLTEKFNMISVSDSPYHSVTAAVEHLVKKDPLVENTGALELRHELFNALPNPLSLSPGILFHNYLFPLSYDQLNQLPPQDIAGLMEEFLPHFPPYDTAIELMDSYLYFFGWVSMPVPKDDLEYILALFYPGGIRTDVIYPSDMHRIAILFMVFALGTSYDLSQDKSQLAAKTKVYYCLARTALVVDPLAENTSLHGVQALMLMIWYLRQVPDIESLSYQWALLGVLSKFLQAIALHRDKSIPTRHTLLDEQREYIPSAKDRRAHEQTFYEFLALDVWQSCILGRPASIPIDEVDCRIPEMLDAPAGLESSFYIWKYSFSRLVSRVMARMLGTTEDAGKMQVVSGKTQVVAGKLQVAPGKTQVVPVEYKDVLELEARLREHYIPENLAWPAPHEPLPQDDHIGKTFQRFLANVWTKTSIMYIHRHYFHQAVTQYQYDPTKSPRWHSVEVAFHSAVELVSDIRRLWFKHPTIIDRMRSFWSHSQSGATILGTLVAYSPGCHFAKDALDHLDQTCDLFARATNSLQPADALANLEIARQKAHEAYRRFHNYDSQFEVEEDPCPTPRAQSPYGYQFYAAGPAALEDDDTAAGSRLDIAEAEVGHAYDVPPRYT